MHTQISSSDYQLLQQLRESQQEAKQLFLRLTLCEQQVLELIANGLPNKAIASLICRSIKTVEKHRSKLMKKLGLASVCEVLRFWCRLRWDEFILGSPTQYPEPVPHNDWTLHRTTQAAAMTPQAADFFAFHNPTRQ